MPGSGEASEQHSGGPGRVVPARPIPKWPESLPSQGRHYRIRVAHPRVPFLEGRRARYDPGQPLPGGFRFPPPGHALGWIAAMDEIAFLASRDVTGHKHVDTLHLWM